MPFSHLDDDLLHKEAMLELVESEEGKLVLRDVNHKDKPLVSIEFSEKIIDIFGDDIQSIGQHMIHAAIQTIMQNQVKNLQAHIHDEEPENYS